MARVVALATILSLLPVATAADGVPANPEAWPTSIDVFRMHRKGSSVPARVERVRFTTYVGRVLQSGALPPDRPMEALKAMAVVVATRGTWLVRHPDRRMTWRGRRFDVTDGSKPRWCGTCDHGMYYRPVKVHSRIRRAVSVVRGALLRRPNGNLRKPAWSGGPAKCGVGVTGNRLPAMGAVSCVRRGYSWRRVLAVYFPKGRVA